ncbi:DNA polymerase III subunit chi [Sphingomonas sp.]|uniref:DNA polymerase III subunit chi n=1 Tax=Sphingomonas sp. TaxID=28214 RepID=UPI002EDB0237
MQVDFYHLTASPIDRVLPMLAEKVLRIGARLLVVAGEGAQRAQIDKLLWICAPDSFLPHAQAGDEDDAAQPILIAAEAVAANGAGNILIADGLWRDEALAFDRAFHLFDEQAIVPARAAWKALAGREQVERRYWKQDDHGKWTQAA